MAKGITIEEGTPRSLCVDGEQVATGGTVNRAGLYADGSDLLLDGNVIAEGEDNTGLLLHDGSLYFGGVEVGAGEEPPTPPAPQSGLWLPPAETPAGRRQFRYKPNLDGKVGFVALYDAFLTSHPNYQGTIKKYEYVETENGTKDLLNGLVVTNYDHAFVPAQAGEYNDNGSGTNHYPLYHYEFIPSNGYTKTFIIEAGIHGDEMTGPQTLYRIMDIIVNHASEAAYSRLAGVRDNVRLIVVPVVCPNDHDHNTQAHGYYDSYSQENKSMNPNRNGDFNWGYQMSNSTGGSYIWSIPETRHIKAIVESIEPKNIDYFFDFHDDTGTVPKHFWFNYNMDGVNGDMSRQLLADLIDYEEELRLAGGKDYRRLDGVDAAGVHLDADEKGYIHPNVADQGGYSTGTLNAWLGISLGVPATGPEYIGGIFGYDIGGTFPSEVLTRSLRIRANIIIYAYELMTSKGWQIHEPDDAKYYHYDYCIGMTRQGLRASVASTGYGQYINPTFAQVRARWNELAEKYPYVQRSAEPLGKNTFEQDVYSYTLGNGNKKVLFIGGSMRWGNAHMETEYGMFILAQYLCDDYFVNQSKFLRRLKEEYTIVVLPCIDTSVGDNQSPQNRVGLNAASQSASAKWEVRNDKCVPTAFSLNGEVKDVPLFMDWISQHQDAIVLLSGGDDTSATNTDRPKYETNYMTQIIYARGISVVPTWLTNYCSHLENDRGESATDVEPTSYEYYSVTRQNLGVTCGDYAFDTYGIPTYFINLKVSNKWAERRKYAQENDNADYYFYRNYETGRRVANIVNMFLMAGGDIAPEGGLVEEGGEE